MADRTTKLLLVFQLKVTLLEIKPIIWRQVLVKDITTLHQLHWIIQLAVGWTNSHHHQFLINGRYYSQPEFDIGELDDLGYIVENEKKAYLNEFHLSIGDKFVYEYDFGDSWHHEILLEKILPFEREIRYPKCIAGKMACPPEDVGGVTGYEHFLQIIKNPKHEEHEDMLIWADGSFDPKYFSTDAANEKLWRKFLQ